MRLINEPIAEFEEVESPSSTCRSCGRALRDPASVAAGIGPTCARNGRYAAIGEIVEAKLGLSDLSELTIERLEELGRNAGKVYVGKRFTQHDAAIYVVELLTGKISTLRHHVKHSPTGMEWGYAGSGPSDTARSILIDVFGEYSKCEMCNGRSRTWTDCLAPGCGGTHITPRIESKYQAFKFDVISRLDKDEWLLEESTVHEWLEAHGEHVQQAIEFVR